MVYMTTAELRFRYNKMDSDQDRMGILADLNGCTKREITDVLRINPTIKKRNRVYTRKNMTTQEDKMLQMYQLGCSDGYIAQKCGVLDSKIYYWRKINNLQATRQDRKKDTPEQKQAWDILFS